MFVQYITTNISIYGVFVMPLDPCSAACTVLSVLQKFFCNV